METEAFDFVVSFMSYYVLMNNVYACKSVWEQKRVFLILISKLGKTEMKVKFKL